jgi:hypothetical protein
LIIDLPKELQPACTNMTTGLRICRSSVRRGESMNYPTYLYYTFGKLEIQKLRDDFRATKGATLRDFHDAFITQGGLPLPLMRRIMLGE